MVVGRRFFAFCAVVVAFVTTPALSATDNDPLRAALNGPDADLLRGIQLIADEIEIKADYIGWVTVPRALALYDRVRLSPALTSTEVATALNQFVRAVNRSPVADMIWNLATVDLQIELAAAPTGSDEPLDLPDSVVHHVAYVLAQLDHDDCLSGPVRRRYRVPFDRLCQRHRRVVDALLSKSPSPEIFQRYDVVQGLLFYGMRIPPRLYLNGPWPADARIVPLLEPGSYDDFTKLLRRFVSMERPDLAEALARMPLYKQFVKANPTPFCDALVDMVASDCDAFFAFLARPHSTPLAAEIPPADRVRILEAAVQQGRDRLLPLIFTMFKDDFFGNEQLVRVLLPAVFSRDQDLFRKRIGHFRACDRFWAELHERDDFAALLCGRLNDNYLHLFEYLLETPSLYAMKGIASQLVSTNGPGRNQALVWNLLQAKLRPELSKTQSRLTRSSTGSQGGRMCRSGPGSVIESAVVRLSPNGSTSFRKVFNRPGSFRAHSGRSSADAAQAQESSSDIDLDDSALGLRT